MRVRPVLECIGSWRHQCCHHGVAALLAYSTARALRLCQVLTHARARCICCARRDLGSNQLSGPLPSSLGSLLVSYLCVVPRGAAPAHGATTRASLFCWYRTLHALCTPPPVCCGVAKSLLTRVAAFCWARRHLDSNRLSGSLPKSLGSLANVEMLCVFVVFVSTSAHGATSVDATALLFC